MEKNNTTVPSIQPGIKIIVDGVTYERLPIKTRLIPFGEKLEDLVRENVAPFFKKGDWLAVSEKIVSISQNRVRHISTVKVSLLARFITLGVKKHKNMTAWSRPEKVQLAIEEAGLLRIIPAMLLGGIGKLFGFRGIFWTVAGHRISEIDGFIPEDMYPYTEWGVLPPIDPQGLCDEVEKKTGIPLMTADANNINVKVVSVSKGVGLDWKLVRRILLDNPIGQGDKKTPFVLVRKVG